MIRLNYLLVFVSLFFLTSSFSQKGLSNLNFEFDYSGLITDTITVDEADNIIDINYWAIVNGDSIKRGQKTFVNNNLIYYYWVSEDLNTTYSITNDELGNVRNIFLNLKDEFVFTFTFWENGLYKLIQKFDYGNEEVDWSIKFDEQGRILSD